MRSEEILKNIFLCKETEAQADFDWLLCISPHVGLVCFELSDFALIGKVKHVYVILLIAECACCIYRVCSHNCDLQNRNGKHLLSILCSNTHTHACLFCAKGGR